VENKKKHINYNLISAGFIYVLCILFWWQTTKIKSADSRFFPRVMIIVAAFFATLMVIRCFGKNNKYADCKDISFEGNGRAMGMLAIIVVYVIINIYCGFYISTLLFLPVAMYYLGNKNIKQILIIDACFVAFIWLFFDKILGMYMPTGLLFG